MYTCITKFPLCIHIYIYYNNNYLYIYITACIHVSPRFPCICISYVTSVRYVAGINHEARGRAVPMGRVIYSGNVLNRGRDICNLCHREATLHRDKTKRIKLVIFFKMLRSKVMASFAHFVGIWRSCRALQFILTATEAAIATQKPNGKLNTAC